MLAAMGHYSVKRSGAIIAGACLISLAIASSVLTSPRRNAMKAPIPAWRPRVEKSLYERCVVGTLTPAVRLRAHAIVESGECDTAIGDGGKSFSRFQLYEVYHDYRASKYGEYDVNDPLQAGRIAALYIQECIYAFPGDPDMQITAYAWGIEGARRHGVDMLYVSKVRRFL